MTRRGGRLSLGLWVREGEEGKCDATRRDVESAGAKQAVPPALPLAILR